MTQRAQKSGSMKEITMSNDTTLRAMRARFEALRNEDRPPEEKAFFARQIEHLDQMIALEEERRPIDTILQHLKALGPIARTIVEGPTVVQCHDETDLLLAVHDRSVKTLTHVIDDRCQAYEGHTMVALVAILDAPSPGSAHP